MKPKYAAADANGESIETRRPELQEAEKARSIGSIRGRMGCARK
jgi:hypothetical protein